MRANAMTSSLYQVSIHDIAQMSYNPSRARQDHSIRKIFAIQALNVYTGYLTQHRKCTLAAKAPYVMIADGGSSII